MKNRICAKQNLLLDLFIFFNSSAFVDSIDPK